MARTNEWACPDFVDTWVKLPMLRDPTVARSRLFYAEHWRVGPIATTLGAHPDTVQRAIERDRFRVADSSQPARSLQGLHRRPPRAVPAAARHPALRHAPRSRVFRLGRPSPTLCP